MKNENIAQYTGGGAKNALKIGLPILTVLLVLLNWATNVIQPNHFMMNVQTKFLIEVFETKNLYLYLHLFTFVPIFLMSFDKKVAFFKRWYALFPALLVVAVIFWVWDVFKTNAQVWGFNPKYYHFLIGNLPLEEWFFFLTFPFAVAFVYECLNAYFPKDILKNYDKILTFGIGFALIAVGLWNWDKSYTATTWIPAGIFAFWHYYSFQNTYRTLFFRSFLVGLIPFYLVNSILTGSFTQEPLVFYNPDEYFGVRIGTIPIDDFAYNFLLEFMVMTVYQFFLKRRS